MFCQLLQQVWVSKAKAVTNPHLRKALCIAGCRMLSESQSLKQQPQIWAQVACATIELIEMLQKNAVDSDSQEAIGNEKAQDSILRQASGSVGTASFGGDGDGYAAKYAKLKYARVVQVDYFSEIPNLRVYLGQQIRKLGQNGNGLLQAVPGQQQQYLQQCCQ